MSNQPVAVFDPVTTYREYPVAEILTRGAAFAAEMRLRRTVRQFSDRPVPEEVIRHCLKAAGTAPSGANLQPWYFVVVSSPALKREILITALHHAGLATLTHTPSPMGFLNRLLGRPPSERPVMIVVTGYPAAGAVVPRITRKPLDAIASFH